MSIALSGSEKGRLEPFATARTPIGSPLSAVSATTALVFPLLIVWALVIIPLGAGAFFWQPFAYWAVLMYAQTSRYVVNRIDMSRTRRLISWLLFTPLLIPWNLLLVKPALYRSILQARNLGWQTR